MQPRLPRALARTALRLFPRRSLVVLATVCLASCQSGPGRRAESNSAETPAAPAAAARSVPKLPKGARLASFPPRPANADGGRAFLEKTAHLSGPEREEAIYREILRGNVPNHLRAMLPVTLRALTRSGKLVTGTAWVLPDYLAVGSDDDYVRVPINVFTATRLAGALGFALPTQKLVNAVYDQATVRLRPRPLPAGPKMTTSAYFQQHNDLIEKQLEDAAIDVTVTGTLIAGHKKDVVLSNRLNRHPNRIAIYGWHKLDATPIQPLSTAHDATYADYSHGIRFIDPVLRVNGRNIEISKVLGDADLAGLLSNEGRIARYTAMMHPARLALSYNAH